MSSKKNFENEFIKSFKSLFDGKKFSKEFLGSLEAIYNK